MKKTIATLIGIIIIHISINAQVINDLYLRDYKVALFGKCITSYYDKVKKDFIPKDSSDERNLIIIKEKEIIFNGKTYKINEIETDEYFHSSVKNVVIDAWYTCTDSSGIVYMMNAVYNKTNMYYFSVAKEEDNVEDILEKRYTYY